MKTVESRIDSAQQQKLVEKFTKAHNAFEMAFAKALQFAKDAGEVLLKLQAEVGLRGASLFARVRKQAAIAVSDRSCFLYLRIARHWNELEVLAGEGLSEMSLSQAVKLLHEPMARKQGKSETGNASHERKSESPGNPSPASSPNGSITDEPNQAAAASEEPIEVRPPFDQQAKLATVFSENGPAPTPIQLMTNIVIPNLKRVADARVGEQELIVLANAIQEALTLLEALKHRYAIR